MNTPQPSVLPEAAACRQRILLLDDDPAITTLVARMLRNLGFTAVESCHSGAAALTRIRSAPTPFDLVILDLNMPGMDGLEFVRRLAECRYRGGLVLLSGESERLLSGAKKLIDAHALRPAAWLCKPVNRSCLQEAVSTASTEAACSDRTSVVAGDFSREELTAALAANEFINHYQPQINLNSGELVGVETLVRWQHPTAGLIPPDRFIPLLAQFGLLPSMTRQVLAAAMHQTALWRTQGLRHSVSVNVSMLDIGQTTFPDEADALACAAGIEPSDITLEVTEGQVMERHVTSLEVLARLSLKGFLLSVDDFGTCYSSLAQLRDLPFDEIKIDRSFVHGATDDFRLCAICDATLRMGRELKLRTVAEGVENRQDLELMRDLGCDVGQGYYFGRPMAAKELANWLQQRATADAPARSGAPGRS